MHRTCPALYNVTTHPSGQDFSQRHTLRLDHVILVLKAKPMMACSVMLRIDKTLTNLSSPQSDRKLWKLFFTLCVCPWQTLFVFKNVVIDYMGDLASLFADQTELMKLLELSLRYCVTFLWWYTVYLHNTIATCYQRYIATMLVYTYNYSTLHKIPPLPPSDTPKNTICT